MHAVERLCPSDLLHPILLGLLQPQQRKDTKDKSVVNASALEATHGIAAGSGRLSLSEGAPSFSFLNFSSFCGDPKPSSRLRRSQPNATGM